MGAEPQAARPRAGHAVIPLERRHDLPPPSLRHLDQNDARGEAGVIGGGHGDPCLAEALLERLRQLVHPGRDPGLAQALMEIDRVGDGGQPRIVTLAERLELARASRHRFDVGAQPKPTVCAQTRSTCSRFT